MSATSTNRDLKRLGVTSILALPLLLLGACTTPTTIVSDVVKAPFEERVTEEQVVDVKIRIAIYDRLADIDSSLLLDISADVWKQRVLMTGSLSDAKLRNQVVRAARDDPRIVDFYNEIQIVDEDEQAQRRTWMENAKKTGNSVVAVAGDMWIESKISALLLGEDAISSVNYRWRSVLGDVSIIGEAETSSELNRVLQIIRDTKGVRSIESYILVLPN